MGQKTYPPLPLCCAALAAGEFAASFAPNFADAWPVAAAVCALTVLFGYGFCWRFWPLLALVLFGATVFLGASVSGERLFRESPWLRDRPRRAARAAAPSRLLRVRGGLSRRIGLGLPRGDETAPLARAILLGERRWLPARTRRLFVESGTMHVFAISGLHVMAVANVLRCALMAAFVPLRFCGVVALPLLWGYVALIGFAPSAVRAALMASFSCLAPSLWRRPDGLRSWSLAFLLVHLFEPRMIVSVGSVLSFAVMLAIVLVGEWSRDLAAWKRALLVTFVAWAVGVPIAAHVFGRVTPGALLANLVLVAAAKVAVETGVIGVLASFVSQPLSAHFNNLSALSIRAMVFVADAVARLPGSNFETGRWPFAACVLWYVVLLALAVVFLRVRERRRAV